jgi:hypothetical protein
MVDKYALYLCFLIVAFRHVRLACAFLCLSLLKTALRLFRMRKRGAPREVNLCRRLKYRIIYSSSGQGPNACMQASQRVKRTDKHNTQEREWKDERTIRET